jgi:monofunctional biosynthetic peptidoglycan transglycosylase
MASERQSGRSWLKPQGSWLARLFILAFVVVILVPLALTLAFRFVNPPATLLMVQRALEGETLRHEARPYAEISPHLMRAVIAAEDAKFCSHRGFDLEAIDNAIEYNQQAEDRGSTKRRGASTISQQTAKNVFLWPQRSWLRKGLETYFTLLIEYTWPKRRILEAYLNVAEWGEGRFGAEAAAQAIFGVSAKDLTPAQAARLAAVLPSPNKWSAEKPGPYVRRRAAVIEQRMRVVQADGLDSCVLPRTAPSSKAATSTSTRRSTPAAR